ncbi:MAG: hypothetical protein HEQ20_15420 [Aphanizomenon flos-aquae KM1D3_PB]|nr:MAG: hypothetical protein HEQ20_15420 [Aphanizomenon flos-aquae KM1D3_PB]
MRVNSGWSGQYGLLDYSCKPSPFRAGLLTVGDRRFCGALSEGTAPSKL